MPLGFDEESPLTVAVPERFHDDPCHTRVTVKHCSTCTAAGHSFAKLPNLGGEFRGACIDEHRPNSVYRFLSRLVGGIGKGTDTANEHHPEAF